MFTRCRNKIAALAPMAGVADRAFREICSEFGAKYVVSEMVSSKGIAYENEKTLELMTISNAERPCGIQIFGNDPKTMASAALFAMRYSPDFIDINMGCPAPKVNRSGGGAILMKSPNLCGEIVKSVASAVPVPVTVKIRKGWDDSCANAPLIAKICEQNGAAAVTVHGRTREQMYKPHVDFEIIRKVKESVRIPVIGNGDITSFSDALTMLNKTGCDMVMVGRAALGNPFIFKEINSLFSGSPYAPPSLENKITVMIKHIKLICKYKGEIHGMKEARRHIASYVKGIPGAAAFRREIYSIESLAQLYDISEKILKRETSVH